MAKQNIETQNSSPEAESLDPLEGDNEIKTSKTSDTNEKLKDVKSQPKSSSRIVYRPSHRATFISLGVIIIILTINAVVIGILISNQSNKSSKNSLSTINLTPNILSKLGVNNSQIGNSNEQLVVDPNAQFNSSLAVAGSVKIGGQLHLNSTFTATSANLTQLQAGNTALSSLNVNGNSTVSDLSARNNLSVQGTADFQGNVNVNQLLTVDQSAAVANNLSVGNTLTANTIETNRLIISGPLTLGDHIVTSGNSPTVQNGNALGNNGTISISGDDAAGIVNINIGTNASSGSLFYLKYNSAYSTLPSVVISPVGVSGSFYITNSSTQGFNVMVSNNLAVGNYSINYIVEQ